jgi:hypothetical protein
MRSQPPCRTSIKVRTLVQIASPYPKAPSAARPGRCDFRVDNTLPFQDRYLDTQVDTIVPNNQRTATLDTDGGHGWLVSFALLC